VIALPAACVLVVVLIGFGDRLARILGLAPGPVIERLSLGLILSTGVVTLSVFACAWGHVLSRWTCLALVLAMAAFGFGAVLRGARQLKTVPWTALVWPASIPDRILALFSTGFVATGLLMALAPPTGMDTGVYHFTIPKLILNSGGLVPRDDVWIHKSGGFYMVYCLGMALGGEIVAKLLGFAVSMAGVGLSAAIAERLRPGTGRLAAFIGLATPFSVGYLGYEYLELPILSYVAASALALFRASESPAWTILACALAGFGVSTKPSAFAVAMLVPIALGDLLRRHRARGAAPAAAGLLAFGLAAGFWSLWNYVSTGSFVYRYPGSAFDEGGAAGEASLWRGALKMLAHLGTVGIYWVDSAGPFIIAGLAGNFIFLRTVKQRGPALLCAACVVLYGTVLSVLWPAILDTGFVPRYLAPVLIGLGGPAAAIFAGWAREQSGPLRIAVLTALILPAVPLLGLKAGKAAVAAPAALGLESRSAYLSKKIETFQACERLNALPEPDVRVLFVAVRPYYLDRPYVWIPYSGGVPFLRGVKTREDFLRRIREERITHVVYEPAPSRDPWFGDPDALFAAPFRELGRWPWKQSGTVRLYAVERP